LGDLHGRPLGMGVWPPACLYGFPCEYQTSLINWLDPVPSEREALPCVSAGVRPRTLHACWAG